MVSLIDKCMFPIWWGIPNLHVFHSQRLTQLTSVDVMWRETSVYGGNWTLKDFSSTIMTTGCCKQVVRKAAAFLGFFHSTPLPCHSASGNHTGHKKTNHVYCFLDLQPSPKTVKRCQYVQEEFISKNITAQGVTIVFASTHNWNLHDCIWIYLKLTNYSICFIVVHNFCTSSL